MSSTANKCLTDFAVKLYGTPCTVEYENVVLIIYWYKGFTVIFILCLCQIDIDQNELTKKSDDQIRCWCWCSNDTWCWVCMADLAFYITLGKNPDSNLVLN